MSVGKHTIKAAFVGLLEVGMIMTALFSVATVFDEWHRFLELFSHFRLQYFVASIALTAAFMVMRWRSYIWIGVAAGILNAFYVVPWFLPLETPEPTDADIKVLHANVLVSNEDTTRFLSLVEDSGPDLIVLQEASSRWLQAIAEINAVYPYRLVEPRDDSFGIALYSRFPLESTAVIESVPLGFPEIIATALIGGERLNIISTHPIPPIGETNYGSRNLQLDAAAQLAALTPEPVMLIGDLNISMWSHHYERVEELSGLQNARKGFGIEPTWPLFMPFAIIPIDHCLVSEGITVTDFRTGPNIGSDHLPIVISMSLTR